ncbi:MAG TPA: cytochrome c biogenesis protein ResB [Terriglobales bacterium]|nr:cytochrome c biogenesis protein ResB [Terriglobales bacterium]
MAPNLHPERQRVWQSLASVRTGIILLILVGVVAAAGTVILQRPATDPEQMQRAYSPGLLRWLDALGLTNVFHSWWFAVLLGLLCLSIVLASLERFPAVWRYFARPYRRPEPHFRAVLPLKYEIRIRNPERGLGAAEQALRQMGFRPERIAGGEDGEDSLYAERNRFARLAAYVVHVSLLLILLGGIVDSVWGYRGFLNLTRGQQAGQIELADGSTRPMPFTLRCDGVGQENYADGTPKRWWSKLVVLQDGREVARKEIAVNDPLVYGGLRFFQANYGRTADVAAVKFVATPKGGGKPEPLVLGPGEPVTLSDGTRVRLERFVPDFYVRDNQIYTRSEEANNPAIQLSLTSKSGESKLWIFPNYPEYSQAAEAPYDFQFQDLEMGYFTGLQVSHEPGQWAVWAGCLLMGGGLILAFYFVHMRFWVMPISDGEGRRVLWVGASPSKNREDFEERFRALVHEIEKNLKTEAAAGAAVRAASLAGVAGR